MATKPASVSGAEGAETTVSPGESNKTKGHKSLDARKLIVRAVAAELKAEKARKTARLAKARFKTARKAFKQAKKAARKARKLAAEAFEQGPKKARKAHRAEPKAAAVIKARSAKSKRSLLPPQSPEPALVISSDAPGIAGPEAET